MAVAKRTRQTSTAKSFAAKVARQLAADYPDADCALGHQTPFELLIATILSAQCTDARVNMVTPALFKKYPNAAAMAVAPIASLEKLIQSTGFYRNKAKNIKGCSQALVRDHDGEVPGDLESLVKLPGVGRKTANVVLGVAYEVASGVVVDTHVGRLSRRLGLTKHDDPEKVEQDLMEALPPNEWVTFAHRMILHGRAVCGARKPKCPECRLADLCPKVGV